MLFHELSEETAHIKEASVGLLQSFISFRHGISFSHSAHYSFLVEGGLSALVISWYSQRQTERDRFSLSKPSTWSWRRFII